MKLGGSIEWKDPNGWTLLHLAARYGNEKMVRWLLANGADISARSERNETPLMMACDVRHWHPVLNPEIVRALLERGSDPNAENSDGETALACIFAYDNHANTPKIIKLLVSHGARQIPGKSVACFECGYPISAKMEERSVQVGLLHEVVATFACFRCRTQNRVELEFIDKEKGVSVKCSCGEVAYVPPTVWCTTCGGGLSTGWEKQISAGREAEKAATEFTSPNVKRARSLARGLKAAHGKLRAIHFKSLHPNFEIDFDFVDGKRIRSGANSGEIVGILAFGYVGGGPNRLQIFLDEMGLSVSAEEIEQIKPGTTMEVEGTSLRQQKGRSSR